MKRTLVTGCAGFIGFHATKKLLDSGYEILGIDNLNPTYDEGLKGARLAILKREAGFQFIQGDISVRGWIEGIFGRDGFNTVLHLAAQAGVRYSLENPHIYVQSNLAGFVNLIEECRKKDIQHFVFASSSSVYGANKKLPFSEEDKVDDPVSLYAATKKSNELIAHVYAHLYDMPVTGLRLFTVYGPWGRPDMAMFKFCKTIIEGSPIDVYNHGQMSRDFTYIDDVIEGVIRAMESPPTRARDKNRDESEQPPYRIWNIGNNHPVEITKLIHLLEERIGKKAIIRLQPMQAGDVPATYANIDQLAHGIGFRPHTPIEEGVSRFVDWYRGYYNV